MQRHLRSFLLVSIAVTVFSACNKVPDHARYIPKDAIAVAGVNLKSLSKKIAWNVITGSKLFKEMQARIKEKNTKDAISGIEDAGIDVYNTFYVYVKTDARFKGGNRITGLVPLSDAGQWEAYVKKVFPNAAITQHGDRKETSLGTDMYVSWTKKLMIIINVMPGDGAMADGTGRSQTDANSLSAEMDVAFNVTKENSVLGNAHFNKLETENHDIDFWLNYDQLMSQYMTGDMADKMGGVSLSNTLWKDAAFTAGFDFIKGKITGDMHYYMSDSLKAVGTELGSTNADKDMMGRLPNQNMDMLVALHLAPKGIKDMLEKAGMLGLANVALAPQNMNADYILDAFSGDMAFVMNDFSLHTESVTDSFMGQAVVHQNQKPSLSMSLVIKIGKKENFQKMVQMAKDNTGVQPMGPNGYVVPLDDKDSIYIMLNDQYLVASNKYPYASGFLSESFKSQKMSGATSAAVNGHPMAMYLDIQQMLKNIDPAISHSAHDSVMILQSKQLLNNISFTGGSFKENAFEYHLDVNFINTEENSIIQLLDFAMKMNDADKIGKQ